MFSEQTRTQFKRFKKLKRAYYSMWILGVAFVLSLFCQFIANDKPLYIRYNGKNYFPVLFFYPDQEFGGRYKTAADYLALRKDSAFSATSIIINPIIPHNPDHAYLDLASSPPHKPSRDHWLGTDTMARDLLARLIYGFRICMLFSLSLMIIGVIFGIAIGAIQGYWGGTIDIIMQRLIEIFSSLPFLYVVILVGSIYGSNFMLLLAVMGIFEWIGLSYYMRGEFYKLKNMTYIRAAQAVGFSKITILFRHILPNALTPVITLAPFMVIGGISALTALDFLGFGLPPPTSSWGELLQQGLKSLYAPWITVSTVLALFITLLLTTFIGEGIREALDPKSEYHLE